MKTWTLLDRALVALCLGALFAVPGVPAQVSLEPRLDTSTDSFRPGTSALDAWAALRDAEERGYSLPGTGLRSFAARVRSPQLERLAGERSSLDVSRMEFVLWWEAPDRRRVTLNGTQGTLEPGLVDALSGLVQPLHELLLPVAPTRRLRGHAFLFVEGPAADGRSVVEARARDVDDPRRSVRFTISPQGLIVREQSETAEGERSDYHFAWRRRGGHDLLVGVTGEHRGERVDLTLDWGSTVDGRPVPTRVFLRRLDLLGEPEGAVPEIEYRVSGHRLDEPLPDWVWLNSPSRAPGR